MEEVEETRFTLMVFPQRVDAEGNLYLNLLFVPRNFNPLEEVDTPFGTDDKAPAFADSQPAFNAYIVNNPDEFPGKTGNVGNAIPLTLSHSNLLRTIYEALKMAKDEDGNPKYFDIEESYSSDPEHKAPKAVDASKSIKKYLPLSYQKAFNFTSPRIKNAVTDDSYACAMEKENPPKKVEKNNKVSWGKVYAHLLRQPYLAERAGLLYRNIKIKINETDFKKGGWLYIDIADGVYHDEQQNSLAPGEDIFIKRYAARIPPLKRKDDKFIGRSLFAAVLFPVMKSDEDPEGVYDELYIESAVYNDGFSKIVHANQPVSSNLLAEVQDGMPPQQEMGIRLGWDDEQILIWYLRQLAKDPTVNDGNDRLDAPLGVMGYNIDVQEVENDTINKNSWESLTAVKSNGDMYFEDADGSQINLGSYNGELPFQVYPIKTYGDEEENYWLPMYFANWNDRSMVLPDKTASDLYMNAQAIRRPIVNYPEKTEIENPEFDLEEVEPRKVSISETYSPFSQVNKLRYGKSYGFRVRLSDISGGGPALEETSDKDLVSNQAQIHFKRYVAPYGLRIMNNEEIDSTNEDLNFEGNKLRIKRPLIQYPAVVYTGKYDNPIESLKKSINEQMQEVDENNNSKIIVGIEDPDVSSVQIKVEIETLKMDNLASDSGRENFITLYTTTRNFKNDLKSELDLKFKYKDFNVIDYSVSFANWEQEIDEVNGAIILPTNRNIRLTLRAKCEGDENYWGKNISSNIENDSRFGKPLVLKLRRNSSSESELFGGIKSAKVLQGIFLQPDPIIPPAGEVTLSQTLPSNGGMPNILQRLAQQLDVDCNNDPKNLTLTAEKGQRIQFWCSSLIRHTLSPDKSSITFAGKNELVNKWLVALDFYIDRDWTWDGLETLAFKIERKRNMDQNPLDTEERQTVMDNIDYQKIGDIDMRRIASFQAIQEGEDGLVHREFTRIVIIDALDPLPPPGKTPDTILVQYQITPFLRSGITYLGKPFQTENLLMPATVNPSQIPKVIASGIALSPYIKDDKYSETQSRMRYLWLEFDQAPQDGDALFARQTAYSPDQLISNNHPSLFKVEQDTPLTLDPEYTRVIIPESGHDHNGLKAMKKMQKSSDEDRHFYLLPLPEGLHHESPELFGFHTYEFRFGHSEQLWSTAQGRFGRPFRLTGLQHPVPTLRCSVGRSEDKIRISAPYAIAVSEGKNVTARPPRTSIWCLLYAQVMQADGKEFRNILIHEQKLECVHQPEIYRDPNGQGLVMGRRDGIRDFGVTEFDIEDISHRLRQYGLPQNSPMSVICVEVFGYIRNIVEHISDIRFGNTAKETVDSIERNFDKDMGEYLRSKIGSAIGRYKPKDDTSEPMSGDLGKYRILRTSPLTKIPETCCVDC